MPINSLLIYIKNMDYFETDNFLVYLFFKRNIGLKKTQINIKWESIENLHYYFKEKYKL